MTYKLAEMPEYRELMVTASSFTGKPVNRFCHLHQSTADLVNKVKMQRLCGSMTGCLLPALRGHGCPQRRVQHHLRDRRGLYGTRISPSVSWKFIKEWQEQDLDGGRRHDRPQGQPGPRPLMPRRTRTCSCAWWNAVRTALWCAAPRCHQTGCPQLPSASSSCPRIDHACGKIGTMPWPSSVPADDPRHPLRSMAVKSCDTRKLEENAARWTWATRSYGGQEALVGSGPCVRSHTSTCS